MLPDGTYVMSQSQVAKAIGESSSSGVFRFCKSDSIKTLLGKELGFFTMTINDSETINSRGKIKVVPLSVATAFWVSQASKGNGRANSDLAPVQLL